VIKLFYFDSSYEKPWYSFQINNGKEEYIWLFQTKSLKKIWIKLKKKQ
jgi:hypothetical protein